MKNKRIKRRAWLGYLFFFLSILFIITAALVVYTAIRKDTDDQITIILAMMGITLALSGACTGIDILRRKYFVDKPVDKILSATEKIATGDFSVRLPISHARNKHDEFDVIFENINTMAKALSDIEVLKTDFISNVSHEIKTPLSVISNYAMLLQDNTLSDGERADYTKILINATRRLTELVTNILQLNKLENQTLAVKKQELRLGDYVGEIILGFEELIDGKHIELCCDLDEIIYNGDKTQIDIVCNNLLSNAIKFTDDGGTISVSLKDSKDYICFAVTDTGVGMSEQTKAHIFDKFYQGDTSHKTEGNGLGLALVKKVVDIMGGEISVDSEPDKGSTFTVKLKK